MHQSDTQKTALLLHAEPLTQIQRVIIAVPRENAAVSQKFRDLRWVVLPNSNRNRRAALMEAFRIANAKEAQLRNRQQALDQSSQQRRFVLPRRAIRRQQRAAAVLRARVLSPPKFRKVIARRTDSCDQLLYLRSRLPAVRKRIRSRAHFVRLELQQPLPLPIQRAHVR